MIDTFRTAIEKEIQNTKYGETPLELYEPIRYIMSLGGKRLRPLLTILAYNLFQENWKNILKPAIAVEVFHNFTLMHDDIMDEAPLRRGKPTVHEKWNSSVAILSGDVMLVNTYEILLEVEENYLKKVITSFNQCAKEVCEGQQWDMNFENIDVVKEAKYLEMIRLKTAVLLGFALELGGILAGADDGSCKALQKLGENIGIGFQLKDDLLDVYADKAKFGKQVGGDIIANKKTFLLINALEKANIQQKSTLENWLNKTNFDIEEKVKAVTNIFDELKIKEITEAKMNDFFEKGLQNLGNLPVENNKKKNLEGFIQFLIQRDY